MFKKSPTTKQLDLFNSPVNLLCDRESSLYTDEHSWHNRFYKNVTSKIDEDIFRPLFKESREDKKDGRPTTSIRVLVAMCILKEGCGCSDESLYEQCRFNLLFRSALGLFNLKDQCPCINSYYTFRRRICDYEEQTGTNLFDKCFSQITRSQAKEYRVSGKSIRMDSKLISSNIAWYSRYEIIQRTFVREVSETEIAGIEDQMLRTQAIQFFNDDAEKTVYRTDAPGMNEKLLHLGLVIDYILSHAPEDSKSLLRRVFDEQYIKGKDGTVSVRDKKLISADSVQNPNDPTATYRKKGKQTVKGYSVNITETTDGKDSPDLIVDAQVKSASAADSSFLKDAVNKAAEITGEQVEKAHVDGAYQSKQNRELAARENEGFDLVANGIQGKPSRFDLNLNEDGTLSITDRKKEEVVNGIPVNDHKWKIKIVNKEGKEYWRYFTKEDAESSKARREVDSVPIEERNKRNNVEATIFQYCYHTRNNKTRYRGKIKHAVQALARCAWINARRLYLFDLKMA